MKARTVLAALAATAAFSGTALAASCEGEARAGTSVLQVEVANLRAARGEVAVTVYPNQKSRFLAPRGKLLRARVKAATPVTQACFHLPPGTYAIAVYHDANANRDFDRNLAGLPAEGFGFSNDAPSRVGLPPLEAVRFPFKAGDPPLRINMRYMN